MIPLGIVSAAGAGVTALPTKIFLLAQITEEYESSGIYPPPATLSVTPDSVTNTWTTNSPYTIHEVVLTAILTYGLDEDYFSNPVVGQSVYFNIGGSIIGDSSLGGASSQTMTTDSNGQISKTFTGGEWTTSFNGDLIRAIFDGNIEGTILASESGTITITENGAA
jgi:hypothetical protein